MFHKNMNLVIVLGSITIVFLICLSLVLLSLKFYILQEVDYEKSVLKETEDKYQTDDFLSLLDSIKKYNASLSKIDNFYKKEAYFSQALKTIIEIPRPKGISFNSIAIEKTKTDNKIKASINGTSSNRDELLAFKSNIESQKAIKNVYLPPNNLIKPINISFNLTFEINEPR